MARHKNEAKHKTIWASHQRVLAAAFVIENRHERITVSAIVEQTLMQRGTVNHCVRDLQTEGLLRRVNVGVFQTVKPKEAVPVAHPDVKAESFIRPLSKACLMGSKA